MKNNTIRLLALLLVLFAALPPVPVSAAGEHIVPVGFFKRLFGGDEGGQRPGQSIASDDRGYVDAVKYSESLTGLSLLVLRDGEVLFERYNRGYGPNEAHELASGTKSFWGPVAIVAAAEGLLDLDERAADTLSEWRADPGKSKITVRQLLNFTSGLEPGMRELRRRRTDSLFASALALRSVAAPGTTFSYGPSHLTAFGALLSRKLKARGMNPDPVAYLKARILDPIGARLADNWLRDASGDPMMAAGASMTASDWARYGQLLVNRGRWHGKEVLPSALFDELLSGSRVNPAYGLTLWLNEAAGAGTGGHQAANVDPEEATGSEFIYREGPRNLFMAAGARGQRLYMVPSKGIVVVRQARKLKGYQDDQLLHRLLPAADSDESGTRPLEDAA